MKHFIQKNKTSLIGYGGVLAVLLAVAALWLAMGRGKNPAPTVTEDVSETDAYLSDVSATDNVSMDDVTIERVRVTELVQIVENGGDWGGESIVQRTQIFMVKILTGEYKGQEAVMTLDLTDITGTGKGVIVAEVGDNLLGYFVTDESGTLVGTCTGFQRDVPLMWLGLGLILLLVLFFGRRGIKSFSALIVTCVMLIFVMIPLIYNGMDPVLAVAVFGSATIIVTLLMVHGPSASSLAAGCGAVGGVLVAALIAYFMKSILWITGTLDEESISLLYTDNGSKLDISAILFAAIVIGSLGGTIDVSVSIASSLEELKEKMGDNIKGWELVRSGMSIGCDIMGASLNTMILAYVGSSLQLLMLFSAYNITLKEIINNEMITVELLRSLAGCFGLLMSVPITSLVAALVTSKGDMGAFRFGDLAAVKAFVGLRRKAGGAWQRSLEEATKKVDRKEEADEMSQVNLFERAKAHYDETQTEDAFDNDWGE